MAQFSGNGKIIQELERFFRGAGWNVIKVVWAAAGTPCSRPTDGALVNIMNQTNDGDYQTFRANDGKYVRDHFFARDPRTLKMVENYGRPGLVGPEARRPRLPQGLRGLPGCDRAHRSADGDPRQDDQGLRARDPFRWPQRDAPDEEDDPRGPQAVPRLAAHPDHRRAARVGSVPPALLPPGCRPPQVRYAIDRGAELGGTLPHRKVDFEPIKLPGDEAYAQVKKGSGKQEVATTMAFVRLLKDLLRDKEFGKRVVPIIPDEARTFGMDAFFPTIKIYNPYGQHYTPVDADLMLAYREHEQGQILHLGINEAGSAAAFIAVGTSYATHGLPMIPVYVFYSMFGFQRTGDGLWAAADQMARGFLIGATAGRTTLTGEGLQHADGHSPCSPRPTRRSCTTTRPTATRSRTSSRTGCAGCTARARLATRNLIYYLTVYNEPIDQPEEPDERRRRGHPQGHVQAVASSRGLAAQAAAGAAARLRRRGAVGAGGPAAARPRTGCRSRRVVGDLLERAAPGRPAADEQAFLDPGDGAARPVRDRSASRARAR